MKYNKFKKTILSCNSKKSTGLIEQIWFDFESGKVLSDFICFQCGKRTDKPFLKCPKCRSIVKFFLMFEGELITDIEKLEI